MDIKAYIGVVSSYGEQPGTVRVTQFDKEGKVSAELPVLQLCTLENKFAHMPAIGESVLVMPLENAGSKNVGDGYVIGSFYNEKDVPKETSNEAISLNMKDGSYLRFDGEGNLEIHATKNIKITVGGKVTVDKA